jgi:hypothetical protein
VAVYARGGTASGNMLYIINYTGSVAATRSLSGDTIRTLDDDGDVIESLENFEIFNFTITKDSKPLKVNSDLNLSGATITITYPSQQDAPDEFLNTNLRNLIPIEVVGEGNDLQNIPSTITANVGEKKYSLDIDSDGKVTKVTDITPATPPTTGGSSSSGCNSGSGIFGSLALIAGLWTVRGFGKRKP